MKKVKCNEQAGTELCKGTLANLYDDGAMDMIEVIRSRGKKRMEKMTLVGQDFTMMTSCPFAYMNHQAGQATDVTLKVVNGKLITQGLRIEEKTEDEPLEQQNTEGTEEPGSGGTGEPEPVTEPGSERKFSKKRPVTN